MKNPAQITSAVFLHPMMLMSEGNNFFAIPEATPVGAAASLLTTAAIALTIVREQITGREIGMPYYTLAAANAVTAVSLFSQQTHSASTGGTAGAVASGLCMIVWGMGHVWRGILQRRKHKGESELPRNPVENANYYTGSADMVMVAKASLINPVFIVLAPVVAAGLALVPKMQKAITETPDTLREFANKHITSSRVLGTTYVAMSAMMATMHDPVHLVAATGLWAAAFVGFDPVHINRSVGPDLKRVLSRSLAKPTL